MRFVFYVVDEADMPPASAEGTPAATPAFISAAIRDHGGRWGEVDVPIDDFAAMFETLDRIMGTTDFMPELAFSGSPHLLLSSSPGFWRLGYFERSLVQHLMPVFNMSGEDIEAALSPHGAAALDVFAAFRSAVEEAASRDLAVAVLHE